MSVAKFLTEEQVAELPEGTPVTIIWTGGNGPHQYLVHQCSRGGTYAVTDRERPPVVAERMKHYNPITFIGAERYHTRVTPTEEAR